MSHEQLILAMVESASGKFATLETPIDDLNFDSLDFVDLMLKVQSEFDVTIPDKDFTRIEKVQDILTIVSEIKGWEAKSESVVSS
jgi:acyl carrier protein